MTRVLMMLTAVLVGCSKGTSDSAPVSNSATQVQLPRPDAGTYTEDKTCISGDCVCSLNQSGCNSPDVFKDFTIVNESVGSFFGSVYEMMSVDWDNQTVTLTSNQTNHQGLAFSFEQAQLSERWRVTQSPTCCKIYRKSQ